MPETVKYGISKLNLIGIFTKLSLSELTTEGKWKEALKLYSLWPGNCLIFHRIASFEELYIALP